jgi:hypothetical protein
VLLAEGRAGSSSAPTRAQAESDALDLPTVRRYVSELVDAVTAVHDAGFVHRDVSARPAKRVVDDKARRRSSPRTCCWTRKDMCGSSTLDAPHAWIQGIAARSPRARHTMDISRHLAAPLHC